MSKTRDLGNITNVIKVDATGNVSFVSGSTTLATISTSGQMSGSLPALSSSYALSASYVTNAETLDGLDSTVFTLTSSFNTTSASLYTVSSSAYATSGSLSATSGSLSAASGSLNTRVSALEVTGSALSSSILSVSASSYSTSGSLSSASGSFNTRISTVESKYATTGSNTFIGTQIISGSILQSGSFTSTGTLTAQTLVVQTITSSVVYSSGSNIFGNSLGNSQVFTGSVLITGSLTIAGGSSATSYSGTTIYGSTAVCSAVGKFTSCIDAGSGTFSGNLTTNSGVNYFNGTSDSVLYYQIGSTTGGHMYLTSTKLEFSAYSTRNMLFETNGTTKMILSNSGNLTLGSTAGTGTGALYAGAIQSKTAAANYGLTHTNGTVTIGTYIEASNTYASFGTSTNHPLGFFTNNNAPQLYLHVNGNFGVGTSTDAGYKLDVNGTGRFTGALTGTSATFSSVILAGGATNIDSSLAVQVSSEGTGTQKWIGVNKNNTYGLIIGYNEISAGLSGIGAYIRQVTTDPMYFVVNNGTTALTIVSTGAATFSSTITGTTIYGSTAVCSPVGKFTSCIDAGSGTFSGCVLIGKTTSAGGRLQVSNGTVTFNVDHNADGPYLTGATDNNVSYRKLSYDASEHIFLISAAAKMRITSGGVVSINQTCGYGIFNVTGIDCAWGEGIVMNPAPNGYSAINFRAEGKTGSCYTDTWQLGKAASVESAAGELFSLNRAGLTGGLAGRSDASQQWKTNGDSIFGFKVGIGTCAPTRPLTVYPCTNGGSMSTGCTFLENALFGQGGLTIGQESGTLNIALMSNSNGLSIIFGGWNGSTNAERMRITSGGNVLIGATTTCKGLLRVAGDAEVCKTLFFNGGDGNGGAIGNSGASSSCATVAYNVRTLFNFNNETNYGAFMFIHTTYSGNGGGGQGTITGIVTNGPAQALTILACTLTPTAAAPGVYSTGFWCITFCHSAAGNSNTQFIMLAG